jgi:multicomponent K+:H+ antiporter subunit D
VLLGAGFLSLLGLARAGSILFWAVDPRRTDAGSGASTRLLSATIALLAVVVAMAAAAGPLKRYADAAAAQLSDPAGAARAVLGPAGGASAVRPYRPDELLGGTHEKR